MNVNQQVNKLLPGDRFSILMGLNRFEYFVKKKDDNETIHFSNGESTHQAQPIKLINSGFVYEGHPVIKPWLKRLFSLNKYTIKDSNSKHHNPLMLSQEREDREFIKELKHRGWDIFSGSHPIDLDMSDFLNQRISLKQ